MKLKGGLSVCDKIVIISGPTASGKSSYGVQLAKQINGEIISVDSMQVYKGLDIGTAKISYQEMADIPHHLLDVVYPNEAYSVADFQKAARQKISDIIQRNKIPILVGGTGLYIQSVVYDYEFERIEALDYTRYETIPTELLAQRLQHVDNQSYLQIEWQNRRRVMHALALAEQTNKSKSEREAEQKQALLYDIFPIAMMPERTVLYELINNRTKIMLQAGLLAEVAFFNKKFAFAPQITRAIGYKEPLDYLAGNIMNKTALHEIISQNTRRFAKRQCTWIRNQRIDYQCVDPFHFNKTRMLTNVKKFLQTES